MKSRYSCLFVVLLLQVSSFGSVLAQSVGNWQSRAPMPTARQGMMALYQEPYIYLIGGRDSDGTVRDLVERYHPETNEWTSFPSIRKARENAAAVLYDGRMMVIGGHTDEGEVTDDVEFFDESENRWVSFSDLDDEREGHTALVLEGELYVLGGSNELGQIMTSVEVYEDDDDEWDDSDWELDVPRASFSSAVLGDSAYVIGGFNSFGPISLVQRYVEGDGTLERAPLPVARGGLASVAVGGRIITMGGRKANNQVVATVERYTPSSDTWQPLAPMNEERESFAAVAVGDRVYVFGGVEDDGDVLASVEVYMLAPAPAVQNDVLTIDEDLEGEVNVLANDTDPDGASLAIGAYSQGAHGVVTRVNDTTLRYAPDPDFNGSDSFTYTAVNTDGASAQGTVTVTIRPVNDAPMFTSAPIEGALVASPYTYEVAVADMDGDDVALSATSLPDWMAFDDNGDGTGMLSGTPTAAELGEASVTIEASDGTETASQAFVVTVVDGAPAIPLPAAPANNTRDVPRDVTLSWSAPGATSTAVQVSERDDFSTLVVDAPSIAGTALRVEALQPTTSYFWRVRGINAAGESAWSAVFTFTTVNNVDVENEVPARFFTLEANYPNPFFNETRIPFEIGIDGIDPVRLVVHDVRGRLIATLAEGYVAPGPHEVVWDGRDLSGRRVAGGVYIYTLRQGAHRSSGKMILIR